MPLPMAPHSAPSMYLSTTFRGTSLVLCLFLSRLTGVGELSLAQVDCFSGCTHYGLDLKVGNIGVGGEGRVEGEKEEKREWTRRT